MNFNMRMMMPFRQRAWVAMLRPTHRSLRVRHNDLQYAGIVRTSTFRHESTKRGLSQRRLPMPIIVDLCNSTHDTDPFRRSVTCVTSVVFHGNLQLNVSRTPLGHASLPNNISSINNALISEFIILLISLAPYSLETPSLLIWFITESSNSNIIFLLKNGADKKI